MGRALKRLAVGLGLGALVAFLSLGAKAGVAAHDGWHVDEWGGGGGAGGALRLGRDCPPPSCTPDNTGEYDPTTLVCRLTREPLGVTHPHLDWPTCTLRRL